MADREAIQPSGRKQPTSEFSDRLSAGTMQLEFNAKAQRRPAKAPGPDQSGIAFGSTKWWGRKSDGKRMGITWCLGGWALKVGLRVKVI